MENEHDGQATDKRGRGRPPKAAAEPSATPTLDFLRIVVQPFPRLGTSAITELGNVHDEAAALEYVMRWPGPIRSACANRRREIMEQG